MKGDNKCMFIPRPENTKRNIKPNIAWSFTQTFDILGGRGEYR